MKYLLLLLLSIIFFSCVIEKTIVQSKSATNPILIDSYKYSKLDQESSFTWNDWYLNSYYTFNPYWNHWYWNDWYWNNWNYSYNWYNWNRKWNYNQNHNWNWNYNQNHNWNYNHKKIRTNIYDIPFNDKPKPKIYYEKRRNNNYNLLNPSPRQNVAPRQQNVTPRQQNAAPRRNVTPNVPRQQNVVPGQNKSSQNGHGQNTKRR
jgi:hypothetical protein